MARKLYLVGAGLSKSLEKAGKPIPLMFDFVSAMADHLDSQVILASLAALELADLYEWKSAEAKGIAERIFESLRNGPCPDNLRAQFRRVLKDRPWESIEDLLERSFMPQPTQGARWYASQQPQRFRYAINQLFCSIGWDVNWYPLERFLRRQFRGDDSHTFVSFNYDLLLDRAIQKCASDWNVQSGYGFGIEYFLDRDPPPVKDGFGERVEGKKLPGESPAKVFLLKPHGSLNWLVPQRIPVAHGPGGTLFDDGPVTVPLSPSGELRYFGSIEPFKSIWLPEKLPSSVEIYIIPPVAAAKSQSSCFSKEVRRREEEAFADADEVYVIGWSLPETDRDQESLIRCSVRNRQRPIGSLTVVNCGARPAYFRRVADMFGVSESSVKIFNAGFNAFVESP